MALLALTLGYGALRGATKDEGRGQAIEACPSSPVIYANSQDDLARLASLAGVLNIKDDAASFRLPSIYIDSVDIADEFGEVGCVDESVHRFGLLPAGEEALSRVLEYDVSTRSLPAGFMWADTVSPRG